MPAWNEAANKAYWSTYLAELKARRTWACDEARGEIGTIPLPCSLPTNGERRAFAERQTVKATA